MRAVLVLHADGLVLRGRLNIRLLGQLFWVYWVTQLAVFYGFFPITMLIKGGFPEESEAVKVCMLVGLVSTPNHSLENSFKKLLLVSNGCFILIVWTLYFNRKVDKFISGHCPRGTMYSIGKYPRNAISFKTTKNLSVNWTCIPVLHHFMRLWYKYFLNPATAYYIDTIFWSICVYLMYICLSISVSINDIPSIKEVPKPQYFYVIQHKELEPRRPKSQKVKHSKFIFVQPK